MRHFILLGIFTLASHTMGCASTTVTEQAPATPAAETPAQSHSCCAKAQAEGKACEKCKKPASTTDTTSLSTTAEDTAQQGHSCCPKAKAEGKACAKCKKPMANCCAKARADGTDCEKCKKPTT